MAKQKLLTKADRDRLTADAEAARVRANDADSTAGRRAARREYSDINARLAEDARARGVMK